ncbi:MAG: sigma-70 family RNA polymerase sigma factor [FCB group bacterium]|nr:sigma-70 family RNA polymerase sigma factor [FCB group bacterium]
MLDRAINGDKQAFTSLVRQYQDRIFGFIMRMTANRESALDLTQDSFLAVWQNLPGFRRDSSFSTWLYQIASNKTINHLKKAKREVPLADNYDAPTNSAGPDDEYERKEQELLLTQALTALPNRQRLVFNLRYYEHLKFHEIARMQGISVSAVKTSFAEALKKLKTRLGGK